MNLRNKFRSYNYDASQAVEIPGTLLFDIVQLLFAVEDQETKDGFTFQYSTAAKKQKNKESKLTENVELTVEEYDSAQSFFTQQHQKTISMLGVMAKDLGMKFQTIHNHNIDNEIAKPYTPYGEIAVPEKPELKLV